LAENGYSADPGVSGEPGWIERIGALHLHSSYSDGSGSVADILLAAREAGLNYVVLTDHDNLGALREAWQGEHDGIRAGDGGGGHSWRQAICCGWVCATARDTRSCRTRRTMSAVGAQGRYISSRIRWASGSPALGIHHEPLYDWRHPAVRGIEIWSYMHDWIDRVEWWRLPAAYDLADPQRRVRGPEASVLRAWDSFGRERRLAGFGGLDCTPKRVPLTRLKVFPYRLMFRLLRITCSYARRIGGAIRSRRCSMRWPRGAATSRMTCSPTPPARGAARCCRTVERFRWARKPRSRRGRA